MFIFHSIFIFTFINKSPIKIVFALVWSQLSPNLLNQCWLLKGKYLTQVLAWLKVILSYFDSLQSVFQPVLKVRLIWHRYWAEANVRGANGVQPWGRRQGCLQPFPPELNCVKLNAPDIYKRATHQVSSILPAGSGENLTTTMRNRRHAKLFAGRRSVSSTSVSST